MLGRQRSVLEVSMHESTVPEFVVGIGASAGGLEPLEQFFGEMASNSGLAFVVIQHLSPTFKSLMDELLGRHTEMEIHRAKEGMRLKPDCVYLIPPGMSMSIEDHTLHLQEQKRDDTTPQLPINEFFCSLASDFGERAIGIIMSGTGSDGSRGIKAIRDAGGLTVAQDKVSAKFDGMPKSAVDTGALDCVAPPIEMPTIILQYTADPQQFQLGQSKVDGTDATHERILMKLRRATQLDFAQYKQSTVRRRIDRRIQLSGMETHEKYAEFIEEDPEEVHRLYRDLLIGVTRFFRDREAFRRLEHKVIPELFDVNRTATDELRVWVAGCATGEEAYSIAILLHERAARMPSPPRIRVFATDAHQTSLEIASAGLYGREFLSEVTPARLQRYFIPVGDEFQVVPELRQLLTFAQQNLLQDAPFTRIDLLTCRNLLIYLLLPAQARIMHLFHFALKVGGILFLGPSETVGTLKPEFTSIDNHWRLYRKRREIRLTRDTHLSLPKGNPGMPRQHRAVLSKGALVPLIGTDTRLLRAYDSLLDEHVPPSILINEEREVIHTFGTAGRFMNPPQGRATLDVLELVHPGLKVALSGAIQRATKELKTVTYHHVMPLHQGGDESDESSHFTLTVKPLPDRDPQAQSIYCLISIDVEVSEAEASDDAALVIAPARREGDSGEVHEEFDAPHAARAKIGSLETELQYTHESLQATIEEMETSNEELNAANEELHSVNEELYTVNSEYQRKITEMTEITDDINNLLSSTDIAVVFLDLELRVRRFTPVSARYFHLRELDIGRPLSDFTHTIRDTEMLDDVKTVLGTETAVERGVMTHAGQSLLLRILPYRTSGGDTAGVVLTLIDTTSLQEAQRGRDSAITQFDAFMANSPAAQWATDSEGRYVFANSEYRRLLGVKDTELIGRLPEEVLPEEAHRAFSSRSEMTNQLARAVKAPLYFMIDVPIGRDVRSMYVSLFHYVDTDGKDCLGGSALDITEQRRLQDERDTVQARYELAIRGAGLAAWDWEIGSDTVTLSETYLMMLGHDIEEPKLTFAEWLSYAHAEDRPVLEASLQEHLRRFGDEIPSGKSRSVRAPYRLLGPEESWRWVVCVGEVTERNLKGSPTRMTGMTIDVSDLKQAEDALSVANAELLENNQVLAERNHELDQFAHAASHDLRSPLRSITGFSEILREALDANSDEEAKSALRRIEEAAKRMGMLIDSLLLFASVGRGELREEPVYLEKAVHEVLGDLDQQVKDLGAKVSLNGDFPSITGDAVMIRQLCQNLLGNALKYRSEEAPEVIIRSSVVEGGEWVELQFEDNGIGFQATDAERAFQPFQRLHGTAGYRGSGLGLSICKRVVERHNGTISVETSPGIGSNFTVRLPIQQKSEGAMASQP